MRRFLPGKGLAALLVLLAMVLLAGACAGAEPTPTPTPTPTLVPTPTPTATPRGAATPTPTQRVVLVATPTPSPTPTPPAAAPRKPEGSLSIALSTLGNQGWGGAAWSRATDRTWGHTMYEPLWGAAPGGVGPMLAKEWSLGGDGKTWTIKLREDVQFHKGYGNMTADDVVYYFPWVMENSAPGGSGPDFKAYFASLEKIDKYSLRIITKNVQPDTPAQYSRLGFRIGWIQPKAHLEKGVAYVRDNPVGTGPFEFVSARPNELKVRALEKHWRVVPSFRDVTFQEILEPSTRIAALKTGVADLIDVPLPLLSEVTKDRRMRTVAGKDVATANVVMCCIGMENVVFNDVRVREALNTSVDWPAIAAAVFSGQARPTGTYPLTPVTAGWEDLPPPPFNPTRARQLLNDAKFDFGRAIPLNSFAIAGVPDLPAMMEAAATYWQNIGLKIELRPIDSGTQRSLLQEGKLGNTLNASRSSAVPDASLYISSVFGDVGMIGEVASNGGGYDFPDEFDNLVKELRSALDPKANAAAANKVMRYWHDNHISIQALRVDLVYGMGPKIGSFTPLPGDTRLQDVAEIIRAQ